MDTVPQGNWTVASAKARSHSHRTGLNLSILDGFLAATAATHEIAIATRNVRHFTGLGLRMFNPWDEA